MTFHDVEEGNHVVITVKNGDKSIILESDVISIADDCLVVDPFRADGGIVSFNNSFGIDLLVVRDGDIPFYWQKVTVEQKTYHEKPCHVIKSPLPGIKYNRRSSFRVPITAPAKLLLSSGEEVRATLRDLSANSFSILVDKKVDLALHKQIMIHYTDHESQKYYELSGKTVRKQELDSYYLYGCIIDKKVADLDNYLAQKQLEYRRGKQQ